MVVAVGIAVGGAGVAALCISLGGRYTDQTARAGKQAVDHGVCQARMDLAGWLATVDILLLYVCV